MKVYNQGELVAETSFLLRSDEWYLIKPSGTGTISGDTLVVSEKTDIDSIIVSWGDSIQTRSTFKGNSNSKTKINTFSAY